METIDIIIKSVQNKILIIRTIDKLDLSTLKVKRVLKSADKLKNDFGINILHSSIIYGCGIIVFGGHDSKTFIKFLLELEFDLYTNKKLHGIAIEDFPGRLSEMIVMSSSWHL